MKTACFTGHRPRDLRGYVGHEAYEPSGEIIAAVADTVDIKRIIKPVYNFKAH